MKFFKQVVAGKKKTLTKHQAAGVELKKYAELSTEFALKSCKEDAQCMIFIPDHWLLPKSKACRSFLWTIVATIRPDFLN
jgi:hypothetical protein